MKENQHVELTPRTFDVLQFLIENTGRVVTKDELLGQVWNGSFVEESNLPVHISKLRRSLGETRENRFIETVQAIGYRFVAPVREGSEEEWQKKWHAIGGAARAEPGVSGPFHSIAVLPLHNETGDPNIDYLTDGLTEGLINGLSQVPILKVIARDTVFRFKNEKVDIEVIGEGLGVSKVLTGRVRILGEDVLVGIELINVGDGTQIWGQHYHRRFSDIVALQEEISFMIVEKLELATYGRNELFLKSPTRDAESYRFYLKGKFSLEKRSVDNFYKAIDFFNHSITIDPANIHSYTEIVDCYRLLHLFDYISYSEFWIKTNPVLTALGNTSESLDVVQVMYCDLRMLEWRFDEAARHCRRALEINPNCLKGRLRYSDLLLQSRNIAGALAQVDIIMTIDPLSPLSYIRRGRLFYIAGRYDTAIAYLNDALELAPSCYEALALRGAVHTMTGNYDEALRDFKESLRAEHHPETLAMTGVVYAKQKKADKAYRIIKQVEALSPNNSEHSIRLAHVYLALGRKRQVFECLERAFDQHEADLRALPYDPRWESIRTEARFKNLLEKVGLPNYRE